MREYLQALINLINYNRRSGSTTGILSGLKDKSCMIIFDNETQGVKTIQRLKREQPELRIDIGKIKIISATGNLLRANFHDGGRTLPIAVDLYAVKGIAERCINELDHNTSVMQQLRMLINDFERKFTKLNSALQTTLRSNKQFADWSTSGGKEWYTNPDLVDRAIQVVKRKEFYRFIILEQQLRALKYGRIQHFDYKIIKKSKKYGYNYLIKPKIKNHAS